MFVFFVVVVSSCDGVQCGVEFSVVSPFQRVLNL